MSPPDLDRRSADHDKLVLLEDKIVQLIEETDNTRDKAYLLILMKINDSMISNTTSINKVTDEIKEISTAFNIRNKEHDAIINRGKGWRDILVWGLGLIQTIGIVSLVSFNSELKDIRKELAIQKIEVTQHIASEFPQLNKEITK